MNIIYIGDNFYCESVSAMSSLYTESGERYDFGFMQRDLRDGKEIHIRQATIAERNHYEARLNELRRRREKNVATPNEKSSGAAGRQAPPSTLTPNPPSPAAHG